MPDTTPPGDPTAAPPRYSTRSFPAYAFLPGRDPHPRRDPRGHSHEAPEPHAPAWSPADYRELEPWLYAIDLFNHGYWWECHEQLEALWLAAGRTTVPAQFVQGILQVAAAHLNRTRGHGDAARSQAEAGLERLAGARAAGAVYMGVDIDTLCTAVRRSFATANGRAVHIVLDGLR